MDKIIVNLRQNFDLVVALKLIIIKDILVLALIEDESITNLIEIQLKRKKNVKNIFYKLHRKDIPSDNRPEYLRMPSDWHDCQIS